MMLMIPSLVVLLVLMVRPAPNVTTPVKVTLLLVTSAVVIEPPLRLMVDPVMLKLFTAVVFPTAPPKVTVPVPELMPKV